jgi:hypothetical protein
MLLLSYFIAISYFSICTCTYLLLPGVAMSGRYYHVAVAVPAHKGRRTIVAHAKSTPSRRIPTRYKRMDITAAP